MCFAWDPGKAEAIAFPELLKRELMPSSGFFLKKKPPCTHFATPRKFGKCSNFRKYKVRFSEAEPVFVDDFAITIADDESHPREQRFVSIGTGMREEFW